VGIRAFDEQGHAPGVSDLFNKSAFFFA
jgi:hypothetical protein